MSGSIHIWTCAAFHPAYRCGGWASVRSVQGQRTGAAGGERNTTAGRIALMGLAWALSDLPPGVTALHIHTTSQALAPLADPSQTALPDEDRDLWARIRTASVGRRLILAHTPAQPGTPTAFAAAWAELARDKAKTGGAFTAAIPKANLAKVPGLPSNL
jgi:hypothetical protein